MEKNDSGKADSRISFDISTSHWKWSRIQFSSLSSSPSPRHLHSLVHHNNYLYLFGGFGDGEKYLDDFWQFSIDKRRWKKMKSKNHPSPRHSHQAVVYQDKMVLFGGISEGKTMNDLWSFDIPTKTWKQINNALPNVAGHSMVVLADRLVIFGGVDEKGITNKLVVLDTRSLEVVSMKTDNAISARQYSSIISDGKAIYLFGGVDAENKSLHDLYKITLVENTNQVVTESLPVPSFVQNLRGASLAHLPLQSQLVLFGGRTDKQLSDATYSFDLRSSKWNACETVGPSARCYHQSCFTNEGMILFGGLGSKDKTDKMKSLNDMWIYSDEDQEAYSKVQNDFIFDPTTVPIEIWCTVLSYLAGSGKSVSSASVVSKQFLNIVIADEMLRETLKFYTTTIRLHFPTITDNHIKLIMLGEGGTGKTALLVRFFKHLFIEEYDPTIDDAYLQRIEVDGKLYQVDILDTAGQIEYDAMLEQWLRGVHGVFFVYSIVSRQSFSEAVKRFWPPLKKEFEDKRFPLVIVGNRSDLKERREVSQEEGKQYAESVGAMWIETSAKSNENVREMFMMLVNLIVEADKNQRGHGGPRERSDKKDRCSVM